MAKFITTSETIAAVESIIRSAKTELVLISPYLQLSEIIIDRLKSADEKGVAITFVYGKDDLKSEVRSILGQLKGLKLFYYKNLHAKCYYNEQQLVISSMNLYEFSGKHNREMGVLIFKNQDSEFYSDATEEAQSIIQRAILEDLNPKKASRDNPDRFIMNFQSQEVISTPNSNRGNSFRTNRVILTGGHCIRCGTGVDFDPERPFCYSCYQTWASFGNPYYEERYCHQCNQPNQTSLAQPLCWSCFKSNEVFK